MRELVAVKGAAHIHQNARNLVHLQHIAATKLDAAMKREEGKQVALVAEGLLDVDASKKRANQSHHSIREKTAEMLDTVRTFLASIKLTLVQP